RRATSTPPASHPAQTPAFADDRSANPNGHRPIRPSAQEVLLPQGRHRGTVGSIAVAREPLSVRPCAELSGSCTVDHRRRNWPVVSKCGGLREQTTLPASWLLEYSQRQSSWDQRLALRLDDSSE